MKMREEKKIKNEKKGVKDIVEVNMVENVVNIL